MQEMSALGLEPGIYGLKGYSAQSALGGAGGNSPDPGKILRICGTNGMQRCLYIVKETLNRERASARISENPTGFAGIREPIGVRRCLYL